MTDKQLKKLVNFFKETDADSEISVQTEDAIYYEGRLDGILDFLILLKQEELINEDDYTAIYNYDKIEDDGVL